MAFEDVAELLIVLDADDRATEKINSAKRAVAEYAAVVDAANAEMAAASDATTEPFQRVDQAIADTAKNARTFGDTADKNVRQAVDDMANAISDAKSEEDALSEAFGRNIAAADKIAKQYSAVDVVSKNLERDLRALHKTLGDAFAKGIIDADDLRAEVAKLNQAMDDLNFKVHTAGSDAVQSFGDADSAVREMQKSVDDLAHSSEVARDDFGNLFGVLREGDRDFAKLRKDFAAAKAEIENAVKPTRDFLNAVKGVAPEAERAAQDVEKLASSATQASGGMSNFTKILGGIALLAPVISAVLLGGLGSALVVVAGIAEKSNTDIVNAFTNLKNTIINGSKDAAAVLVPTMVTAMNDLSNGLKAMAPQFKELFSSLKPVVVGLGQAVLGFVQGVMPGLNDAFKNIAPLANIFGSSMKTLGQGLGGLFANLAQHMPSIVAGTKGFFDAIGNLLPALGDLLGELSDLVGPIEGALLGPLSKVVEEIIKAAAPAFKMLGDVLGQLGQALAPLMPPLTDLAKVVIQAVIQGLKALQPAFNAIINAVKQLMPSIIQLIQAIIKIIPPVAQILVGFTKMAVAILTVAIPAIAAIIKVIVELVTLLVNGLVGPLTWVANKVNQFADYVSKQFQQAGDWISKHWNTTLDGVKKSVMDQVNAVVGAYNWMKDHIVGAFNAVKNFLYNVILNIIGFFIGFKQGAQNAVSGVIQWFEQLPGRIGDLFKDAWQWLVNAGKAVLDGFLNGVKTAWNNVMNFFSGIGTWISQHKGPIEKDAQLLVPHGNAIMGGLLKGLKQGSGPVQRFLTGFTTDLGNTPLSASLSAAMSGGIGAGVGSSAPIQLVFTGNQVMNDQSIEQLAQAAGKQVAKYMLPRAGRYVRG